MKNHQLICESGFSLIEMVVVIVITGIIVAAVAGFVSPTVTGYVSATRRAELVDIADTALRRVERDLHNALPNSVRVTNVGSVYFLEYLEVRTGGRYRADTHSGGATAPACPSDDTRAGVTDNDILSFYQSGTNTDTCFKTLGNIPNRAQIANNSDLVVVFNLGIPGADAYESPNTNKNLISSTSTSSSEDRIDFVNDTNLKPFRLTSPGNRFDVISGPVSYVCDPVAQTLRRYSGYAIQAAQPNDAAAAPLSTAPTINLLASNISACTFTYNAAAVAQRNGLVTLSLGVTEVSSQGQSETVNLYKAVHVSNVP